MSRPDLSVQLYSVREKLPLDPDATLRALADLGFTSVEPYDLVNMGDLLAEPLQRYGLAAPTAHASVVGADLDALFAAASRFGVTTVYEPIVRAERWGDAASIAEIAAELNAAAERAEAHGIQIGYHNHWWELEGRIGDVHALEVLVDHLDDRVVLELDAYWAAVGGADPVALVRRLGSRVTSLHVKDGPVSRDNSAQLPAGQGDMPWSEVFAAAPQARLVVEFDQFAGDVLDGIGASRRHLVAIGEAS